MRALTGPVGIAVGAWTAATVVLHLHWAGFGFPEPLPQRATHLMLLVPPVFLLFPAARPGTAQPTALDWLLAALALPPHLYVLVNARDLLDRTAFVDPVAPAELVLGTLGTLLVVEATRRALSITLAILVGVVIAYLFTCHLMPGIWYYRPLPYAQIIDILYIVNNSGLYGFLTGISAGIVILFIAFGALAQASGLGELFHNFGLLVAGRYAGGPAKVEVVGSALFGTISGSSVANVVVTGTLTIPLMIRRGFRPVMAGGIEAASSVGGAIMPPVMGAAAFVMAEIVGVPYFEIAKAAALGAVLYYLGIFLAVHFEAKRLGMGGLPASELPRPKTLLRDAHLVLPIVLLVALMAERFSATYACFWATVALVLVSWLRGHTRLTPRRLWDGLIAAGATAATLAVAVASAGIVTAALVNTGLLLALSGIIKGLAAGSLPALAVLLAITCLVLGMGVPTTPAYIVTAAIGVPLLADHGVGVLAAHLFVFYFAVLADATPPVAAASYAAAAIAKAPPLAVGFHAFRLAIGGFLAGLAFVWEPALLLRGTLFEIAAVFAALGIGIALLAVGSIGFLGGPVPPWLRLLLAATGLFCGLAHGVETWQRALAGAAALGLAAAWTRREAARIPAA
jgi:TRAP transporter 4TM/12TM fusion protein